MRRAATLIVALTVFLFFVTGCSKTVIVHDHHHGHHDHHDHHDPHKPTPPGQAKPKPVPPGQAKKGKPKPPGK